MDDNGFKTVNEHGHLVLYRFGQFQCSGDNEKEIEEEKNNILGCC